VTSGASFRSSFYYAFSSFCFSFLYIVSFMFLFSPPPPTPPTPPFPSSPPPPTPPPYPLNRPPGPRFFFFFLYTICGRPNMLNRPNSLPLCFPTTCSHPRKVGFFLFLGPCRSYHNPFFPSHQRNLSIGITQDYPVTFFVFFS